MPPSKPAREPMTQLAQFQQAARAIGADEDETAFRAKLAVIARHKPKEDVPEPQKVESRPRRISR